MPDVSDGLLPVIRRAEHQCREQAGIATKTKADECQIITIGVRKPPFSLLPQFCYACA